MIKAMLTNDRTGEPSSSRAFMFASFTLSALMYAWAAAIYTYVLLKYGPEMLKYVDLSWYLGGGTGSLISGIGAYGFNKLGDRNLDAIEPLPAEGMESPEEQSVTENQEDPHS